MATKKTPELIQHIEKTKNAMQSFLDNAEKDSKAAWMRARKASLQLERLLKDYRKLSVKAGR